MRDLLALTPREQDRAGADLFFYPGGAGFETARPARIALTPSITLDRYIANLPSLAIVGDLDHDGHPDALVSDVLERAPRGGVRVPRRRPLRERVAVAGAGGRRRRGRHAGRGFAQGR